MKFPVQGCDNNYDSQKPPYLVQAIMSRKRFPTPISLVFLISCWLPLDNIVAASFSYSWPIKELARSNDEQIVLRKENGGTLKKVNTQQLRYLYTVKTSIETVAETVAEFLLVDGDQPNAFAGHVKDSGRAIGVNFAMVELLGLDVHAMAALIGHELAHLRLEHGKDGAKKKWGVEILKGLGAIALSSVGVGGAHTISDTVFTAIETKYSRDDEREADYLGMIWAIEAGYEAEGGVRLFEELSKVSKIRPLPFISTHPSPPERIETMKRMSQRLSR